MKFKNGKTYSCLGLKEGEDCAVVTQLNKLNNIEKLLKGIGKKK